MQHQCESGRNEAVQCDPQEDQGVGKGNDRTPAIGKDCELGHTQIFECRLSSVNCLVICHT